MKQTIYTLRTKALNEIENRIENRLPIFGYDQNTVELNDDFELHLFSHGATYTAEIWDNGANEFFPPTVAESRVIGTGDFADDLYYLVELVFEDLEKYLS